MSDFFNTDFKGKAKNDFVANALLQMNMGRNYRIVRRDNADFYNFAEDRTITNEPVQKSISPAVSQAIFTKDTFISLPRSNETLLYDSKPTLKYIHDPQDYWRNMTPENLYNLQYVNKPNPIFNAITNTPLHFSSIHRNFSS